jgi:hypothetical protein
LYNPDGSVVLEDKKATKPRTGSSSKSRRTVVVHVDSDEEETKGDHLERGQVQQVNPDTDSVLNSDAE